jgi:adenosylhomocysteinase
MGARVYVVEADPLRALEAAMDGFHVTDMEGAAPVGDFFVTATGNVSVIDVPHFEKMKDGAVLANAGHFNVEINLQGLAGLAEEVREVRREVREYRLPGGRRLYLVAEGRLVNLAAAEGHPAAVMDLSFANQALVLEWLAAGATLAPGVHAVPEEIDRRVAELKLASLGMRVQRLSDRQKEYLAGWQEGTE